MKSLGKNCKEESKNEVSKEPLKEHHLEDDIIQKASRNLDLYMDVKP